MTIPTFDNPHEEPSVEAAVDCYNSPEYQEALDHARGASERELMVVETSE